MNIRLHKCTFEVNVPHLLLRILYVLLRNKKETSRYCRNKFDKNELQFGFKEQKARTPGNICKTLMRMSVT